MHDADRAGQVIQSRPHKEVDRTMGGFTRSQLQILAIGAVALMLPLCFVIIIFALNFGGIR
jgi:hypothetical protein